eukprot:gb/GECH01009246.1/.p1 GENE.gb/GECH01009246.1/~~gb/GECH01009246.1/.p1  ORF type:complete len:162 (+),score=25.23 gb/GECH01009246.1/:1-486(+)
MEETDYKFNGEGKLVDKHSGKPFVFQTQEHYKKVGNAVVSYIQNIMRGPEFQMKEMVLPLDQNQDSNSNEKINTPKTHIFYTSDAFTTLDKPVLIILQGKGPVRAGQWSRSLCVNDRIKKTENRSLIMKHRNSMSDMFGTRSFQIHRAPLSSLHSRTAVNV